MTDNWFLEILLYLCQKDVICGRKPKLSQMLSKSSCPTCSSSSPPFGLLLSLLFVLRSRSCFPPQHFCRPLCRSSRKHRLGEGWLLPQSGAFTSTVLCIVPPFPLSMSDGLMFYSTMSIMLSTGLSDCLSTTQVWVWVFCAQKACCGRQLRCLAQRGIYSR